MSQPLKWHGGKHYLAKKIIGMMPPHTHYVEPYFGGGAVLLAKDPEGVSEVVNDINGDLSNFWQVLQGSESFDSFKRLAEATPFAEAEFNDAALEEGCSHPVVRAWRFFIRCRQSMSGRMTSFAPTSRTRTRRGMNEQVASWLTAIEGLPAVHARLKRVFIQSRPALDCVKSEDGNSTLFYLDPPYLHGTRTAPSVYQHEMTEDDHRELLDLLPTLKGKFLLSGYSSALYCDAADRHRWWRQDFPIDNKASKGKSKRRMVECVWSNFK